MTKRNLFLGAGAVVLAVSSALAGRASVKASLSTIYVSTAGGACRQLTVAVASNTFTTGGSGTQASIKTVNGAFARKIWGTANCSTGAKPVRFHG